MIKIKLSSIIYLILIALPVLPIYNRFLTHARPDRFSFNFKTLFLEYTLILFLIILLFTAAKKYKKCVYDKNIIQISVFALLICLTTFFSVIFSWDISRSLYLFMFGILGPLFLYVLIAIYMPANEKNLDTILKGFLSSVGLYLIISFLFTGRTLSFSSGIDLLELRIGGNIYGSNAVIGSIAFLLPLVFIHNNFTINEFNKRSVQVKIFSVISILWIILSISRWGYAVLIFAYILTTILLVKKVNIKFFIGVLIIFSTAFYFVGNIGEVIIDRFTGGGGLLLDNIIETTQDEPRFVRWENALTYIKQNLLFGIGLGNNYLIDIRQSPGAHNLLINFTVERGVIALFTLVGLVFSVFRLNKKLQKHSTNYVLKRHSKTLILGIVIFFFWSLTGGTFIQAGGIISAVKAYYFMIVVALIVLISRVDSNRS